MILYKSKGITILVRMVKKKSSLKKIWDYLKVRKINWLPPLIFTILVFIGIFIFAGGAILESFTYTL